MRTQRIARRMGLMVLLWLATPPAYADIYKWVDKDGNIHFGDRPPADRPAERRESSEPSADNQDSASTTPADGSAPAAGEPGSASAEQAPLPKNASVVMYTTSWCGYCKKAREYFNSRGIYFTDFDIEKDPAAMERRLALGGGKSVPLVIVNGAVIRGYSALSFDAALRRP